MQAEKELEQLKSNLNSSGIPLKALYLLFLPNLRSSMAPGRIRESTEESQENFHPNYDSMNSLSKVSILSSKIDFEAWIDFFESNQLPITEEVKTLFTYYDGNEDGEVTYAEFVEELLPKI